MSDIDRKTGKLIGEPEAIRQAIENILRTKKGERIMRPEFGVSYQNANGTAGPSLSPNEVEREAREAVLAFEPRINLLSVQPHVDGTGTLRSIVLEFARKSDGHKDTVTVEYAASKSP